MAKVEKLTTASTEADLEASFHAAVRTAFPWLPPGSLRHQTKFEFKFGHRVVQIDGTKVSRIQARSDILVFFHDTPLAVLELKRQGLPLTPEDREQGLSYARMLHPRPPLVVITNSKDTISLTTHTGQDWAPETPSEVELNRLIGSAAEIAVSDLKRAVETLLGPRSLVWVAAVRAATDLVISDMTGAWGDADRPFVNNFLIPRKATEHVMAELRRPKRAVIVDGAPLVGKSTILREIVHRCRDSADLVILFVEADDTSSLIQTIAGVLADALGWHVTADETRSWLRSMSRQPGPALALAVDGIGIARDEVRRDIDELTGDGFGDNLRVILAMDDTVTPKFVRNSTGRNTTRLGRRSSVVTVGPLDDDEFGLATNLLQGHRIGIVNGGQSTPEYRIPWVIRSLVAGVVEAPEYADENLVAGLPPLLGPDILCEARRRFEYDDEVCHWFRGLAEAVLVDLDEPKRSVATVLESIIAFSVRRNTVRNFIESTEIRQMIDRGLVKFSSDASNQSVIVPRLPELLASEIAAILSRQLADQLSSSGAEASAKWLVAQCATLPLGDVIGARALLDCATDTGSVPLSLIQHMLNDHPRAEKVGPGARVAMILPDTGLVELKFREDGTILARAGGRQTIISADEEDEFGQEMFGNIESWLILAHVAGQPFVAESCDGTKQGRGDPALLIEIGTCPFVLRRPVAIHKMNAVLTHDIDDHGSIVCHKSGIVEPITLSILKFFDREHGRAADEWLLEAVARESLPLLARVDIALRHVVDSGETPRGRWARDILAKIVAPAFRRYPPLHRVSDLDN